VKRCQSEMAGFGGGIFGLGTHPTFGVSSGLAFSRYALGLLEVSYAPSGSDTLLPRADKQSPQNGHLFDFNTSFHIRIPVRERWAPYAIVGGGLLLNSYQAITGSQGALMKINDYKFGFHTGGGLRYYVRDNWGIRPEFRVTVGSRTYTRLSVGVFYVLSSIW